MKPFSQWTEADVAEFNASKLKSAPTPVETAPSDNAVSREGDLHDDIIKWCDSQWPRVKYIHARTDKKSTIQVGCQDFTLFLPCEVTLKIECKAKGGKLDEDQLIWKKEMQMQAHKVAVIYNYDDFLKEVGKAMSDLEVVAAFCGLTIPELNRQMEFLSLVEILAEAAKKK